MRGDRRIVEATLTLIPLRRLRPHERIVSRAKAGRIASSILSMGLVYRPIIVEEETLTIIDGHHRYTALTMLGAKYAPVILARYGKEIKGIDPPRHTITVRAGTPGEALSKLADELEKLAGHGPGRTLLECRGERLTLHLDPLNTYYAVEMLARHHSRREGAASVTVTLPKLTYKHVLAVGENGEKLPPRSTLHRTPLKKIFIPVKLKTLT